MKPTAPVFILLCAAACATPGASGQSTATKSTTTRTTTHRSTTAHRPAAKCADMPVLGAAIPKVEGCPKVMYALRYIDTVVGTGAAVTPRKWLTVNYTGYLVDGTKFDSSFGAGPDGKPRGPITFPYGARQVITGWDTGFEGMNIGGKRRLFVPYQLAYGEMGRPPIPPKAELIFDVELLGISDSPPAQKAPESAIPPTKAPPSPPVNTSPEKPATPGGAIPPTSAPPAYPPANSPNSEFAKPAATPSSTPPAAAKPQM